METQKNRDKNPGHGSQGNKDQDKEHTSQEGQNQREQNQGEQNEEREQRPYQGIQNAEPQYKEDKSPTAEEKNRTDPNRNQEDSRH